MNGIESLCSLATGDWRARNSYWLRICQSVCYSQSVALCRSVINIKRWKAVDLRVPLSTSELIPTTQTFFRIILSYCFAVNGWLRRYFVVLVLRIDVKNVFCFFL